VIAVDTSVWIAALRNADSDEARGLSSLIDADAVVVPAPVRSELLMGVRGAARKRLAETLTALPLIYPTDESWRTLDAWTERAGRQGHQFALGDLLVGVVAAEHDAPIWSLDGDFKRLSKLKLVRLY
jgi:predicted nucleic acid-binding protein